MSAHHVYANGHEIASRSSDGQSNAMGDVCFTPPTPPATGVPIPYPNTVFGKDIRNGSRTVFIAGKEVALSNKSYFHKSIGDNGATKALKKGIVSGNIEGRAFFTSWSMNVKIEGEGVARDMDTVTHNHSNPANTALFPFLSRNFLGGHDCKKQERRINKACSDSEVKKSRKKKKLNKDDKPGHWSQEFCDGLNIPTNTPNKTHLRNELNSILDTAAEEMEAIKSGFWGYLSDAAIEGASKLAARTGAKIAAGAAAGAVVAGAPTLGVGAAPGAGIGGIIATIVSVGDAILTISRLPENIQNARAAEQLYKNAGEAFEKIGPLMNEKGELTATDKELSRITGDFQELLATLNPCIRARKCSLIPHKKQGDSADNVEPSKPSKTDRNKGVDRGCCTGQQGHHLIPQAAMKGVDCPGYKDSDAPVVCVEGGRGSGGSHERIHNNYDIALQQKAENKKVDGNGKMSLNEIIDVAAESHTETFPLSGCGKDCIKAQLEDYYGHLCPNAKANAVNQNGKTITDEEGQEDGI